MFNVVFVILKNSVKLGPMQERNRRLSRNSELHERYDAHTICSELIVAEKMSIQCEGQNMTLNK